MKPWIMAFALALILLASCKEKEKLPATIPQQNSTEANRTVVPDKHYEPRLPTKTIEIGGKRLLVEVADDDNERATGLMFRAYLPDTVGMIFIFDEIKPHPFWMKNTFIPLDIAFVTKELVISDIMMMKPHDESNYSPSQPIKYAIETNQGWFMKHNIKPGAKVKL